jgi:predicted metal-dependent peptidase
VFEHLEHEPEPWDVLVYLTDGFGDAPHAPPAVPTLWLLVPGGVKPAKWGEVAWMETGDGGPAGRRRPGSGARPGFRPGWR